MQAAKIKKGSDNAKTTKVATIKKDQVKEIAEYKMEDLNTDDVEAAINIIAGTAKNMGILIDGIDDVEAEKAAAAEATVANAVADAREAQLEEQAVAAAENKEFVEADAINGSADEESSEEGDK